MSTMESDDTMNLSGEEEDLGGLDQFSLDDWEEMPLKMEEQEVQEAGNAYAASEDAFASAAAGHERTGVRIALIAAAAVLLVYIAGLIFFQFHFLPNTRIDSVNCAWKTAKGADQELIDKIDAYTLTLEEHGEKTEYIYGRDIDLQAEIGGTSATILKQQKSGLWFAAMFQHSDYHLQADVQYDAEKLAAAVQALQVSDSAGMTAPVDAHIAYDERKKTYYIDAGDPGSVILPEVLMQKVKEAVESLKPSLDLQKEDCYQKQAVLADDENLKKNLALINAHTDIRLELQFGENKETLSISEIYPWISSDEKGEIVVDAGQVTAYAAGLAEKYNTYDKDRTLHTSWDFDVTVEKGDYGWKMDVDATAAKIADAIRAGGSQTVEPEWAQTANAFGATDWGNTYVEVNLTKQHLYYYKEGQLVQECDFVSGTVSKDRSTPTGIYSIKYRKSPAILRGINWETPVNYWMPFFDGCGMHDATWRRKFGGTIYYYNGSHGCLNMPIGPTKIIYDNIVAGTPILIYKTETEPVEVVPVHETPWPEGYPTAVPTEAPNETSVPVEVIETPVPVQEPAPTPPPAPPETPATEAPAPPETAT